MSLWLLKPKKKSSQNNIVFPLCQANLHLGIVEPLEKIIENSVRSMNEPILIFSLQRMKIFQNDPKDVCGSLERRSGATALQLY